MTRANQIKRLIDVKREGNKKYQMQPQPQPQPQFETMATRNYMFY
jgi:hypothetical protein